METFSFWLDPQSLSISISKPHLCFWVIFIIIIVVIII